MAVNKKKGVNPFLKLKNFFQRLVQHPKMAQVRDHALKMAQEINAQIEKDPVLKKYKTQSKTNRTYIFLKKHLKTFGLIILFFVAGIVAANFYFPRKSETPALTRVVRADVFELALVDFKDDLPAMGQVRGADSVDVGFQVGGVVAKINFLEGAPVNKGDVIASLDDTDARLKFEYQENKLKASEKKLEVHKELYALKSIIKAKLQEIEYEYESQKKELEFARQELSKTRLVSPITGVIGTLEVEEGEIVTAHTKVTSVSSIDYVYVDLGIIEKDISKVRPSQLVEVSVDAYPGVIKPGEIISVSPVVEGRSRNFKARAKILNDDNNTKFLPGMFARAKITVYFAKNVLAVPLTAVNQDTVYLVKDKKLIAQKIKTGYTSYDYVEILEGLNAQDIILAEIEGDLSDQPTIEALNARRFNDNQPAAAETAS